MNPNRTETPAKTAKVRAHHALTAAIIGLTSTMLQKGVGSTAVVVLALILAQGSSLALPRSDRRGYPTV